MIHSANLKTPALVCHGTADFVVRTEAGKKAADVLKEAGVPVSFKTFSGMGHSAVPQELSDVASFVQTQLQ